MAEDITSLVLKVESKQVGKASKDLDKLSRSGRTAEKATDQVTGGFKKMIVPLLALGAGFLTLQKGLQGFEKLVSITREFDILNAQLVTSTGSAKNAAIAFEAIQDFATDTPFQLGEVTEAFVQLVNRGLDPSERSLTNIGNFASAFGRNILDTTRAIGQATTGEFESLKQFGIVARKEGERVKFTFRGMTQEVAFNAKEIQGYMNDLAENNFAGAMGERMNTLDGALSNLDDSYDKLFLTISSDSPIGDAIESSVRKGISFLEMLEKKVRELSGEEVRSVNELVSAFDTLSNRMENIDRNDRAFASTNIALKEAIAGLKEFSDAQKDLARNQNALDTLTAQEDALTDAVTRQRRETQASFEARKAGSASELQAIAGEKAEIQSKILLLENEIAKQREADGLQTDRLAGFVQSGDMGGPTDKALGEFQKLQDSLLNEEEAIHLSHKKRADFIETITKDTNQKLKNIETLRGELMGQEQTDKTKAYLETLQMQEDEALKILENGTVALVNIGLERDEALAGAGRGNNALNKLREDLEGEYVIYQDYFAEKKGLLLEQAMEEQEILDNALDQKELSDEEFRELSKERWDRYSKDIGEITRKQTEQTKEQTLLSFSQTLGMVGGLSNQLQTLAAEGSDAQKVLFAASKGIAIAQAIINTELAASKALAYAENMTLIQALGSQQAIRAVGYASVGIMAAQVATGNYADGGIIPGTSFAGDNLTANVNSGEMVLNRDQQNRLFSMAKGSSGGSSGGGATSITVVNNAGVEVEVEERKSDNGEKHFEIMLNKFEKTIASRVSAGGSLISRSIESTYGVKRGNA